MLDDLGVGVDGFQLACHFAERDLGDLAENVENGIGIHIVYFTIS